MVMAIRPLSTLVTISEGKEKNDPSAYEVSQSPSFRIHRITPQGGDIDKVEFTYDGRTCVALTDRRRSSVVIQSTIHGGTNSKVRTVVPWVAELKQRELEPEPGRDGTLRCRRIEFTATTVGKPIMQHTAYEFSDYVDEAAPDEEFTLSHYGLPEPVGVESKKRVPNYVWFLVGAAAFALLAIALRYVAKRRTPPAERGAAA